MDRENKREPSAETDDHVKGKNSRRRLNSETDIHDHEFLNASSIEDSLVFEIQKDECIFEAGVRSIQIALKIKVDLIFNMKKNPMFEYLKLKCDDDVTQLLKDLDDSKKSYLYCSETSFPGDVDIRTIFKDVVQMNLSLTKLIIGFHTDMSKPNDMVKK